MNIIWKGSPNKNNSDYRLPIDTVVLHWFGMGTLDSANTRFQNPANQVSAHYGISGNTIYQWVKEEEVAWHAGNWAVNQRSIGIENDATTDHNASDETYQSVGQLLKEICERHSIPLDRTHILKHSEVVPTQCPGTLDIDKIIAIAKGESTSLTEDITTSVEDKFGLKSIDRYNKYWTYEELISDWVNLTKEVEYEKEQKEEYKTLSEGYKETCQSQAEEIANLNKEIKTLSDSIVSNKAEILSLQQTLVSTSTLNNQLTEENKSAMYRIERLVSENKSLTDKLISLSPLKAYSSGELLKEIFNRLFRKEVI